MLIIYICRVVANEATCIVGRQESTQFKLWKIFKPGTREVRSTNYVCWHVQRSEGLASRKPRPFLGRKALLLVTSMNSVCSSRRSRDGVSRRSKTRLCIQVFHHIDCIDDAVQMATPVPETSRGSLGWFMVVQPREMASWDEVPMRTSSREGVSRRPIAEDGCARHSPGVQ